MGTIDRDFIRRAVELADLDAVRVTLYQDTGAPALGATGVQAVPIRRACRGGEPCTPRARRSSPGRVGVDCDAGVGLSVEQVRSRSADPW